MVVRILSIVFGAIGGALLLIALILAASTGLFISQASVADGTVIGPQNPQSGRSYASTIQFTTSTGQVVQFTTGVRSSPPEFQLGQKIRVYYNSDNPESSARPASFISLWFLPGLFGLLGIVFGGLGLGFFTVGFLHRRKLKWLALHGERITAEVTGVRVNTSVRNMGKSPYYILAQWHDPARGQSYTFRSDNIWTDRVPFSQGDIVSVLVDPQNFGRYHVEIEDRLSSRR